MIAVVSAGALAARYSSAVSVAAGAAIATTFLVAADECHAGGNPAETTSAVDPWVAA